MVSLSAGRVNEIRTELSFGFSNTEFTGDLGTVLEERTKQKPPEMSSTEKWKEGIQGGQLFREVKLIWEKGTSHILGGLQTMRGDISSLALTKHFRPFTQAYLCRYTSSISSSHQTSPSPVQSLIPIYPPSPPGFNNSPLTRFVIFNSSTFLLSP